jgi:hypothetical protein
MVYSTVFDKCPSPVNGVEPGYDASKGSGHWRIENPYFQEFGSSSLTGDKGIY